MKGTLVFGTLPMAGTGMYPVMVATEDLNGDGKLDLVISNFDSNTLSVLLGKIEYAAPAGGRIGVSQGPALLELGDLNGDGMLDLFTANQTTKASVLLSSCQQRHRGFLRAEEC
jgi:hypothetical protein